MIAFPTLALADYFPRNPVVATSFVVTAELGGAVVCPILLALWRGHTGWSFSQLWYVFAFGFTLPLGLVYVVTLPPTKFSAKKNLEEEFRYMERVTRASTPNPLTSPGSIESSLTVRSKKRKFRQELKSRDFWAFEVIFNVFMLQVREKLIQI
eukprot:Blabericola_migrator_1__7481@NODE_381_length_9180_cov_88_545814_g304_i0_p6_GENE_NODE_381_length_9180_cov_88_545814_g304_i0NODE_381_length_9180_cov_88_545814_g304_i0_p6_ORF_typecomplete_len153_score20_43MFS_1/PF07690_16/6_6e06_NODE_381_length_9180_cov_88_545814_g304_i052805738